MMRVRKNDTVVVLSGKDKDKRGTVLLVDAKKGKALVKGVAIVTRHVKPRRTGEAGGIRKEEAYINLAKIMPVCPSCNKPARVNIKIMADQGTKSRVCNRCKAAW
jgi:large subunit ribosomal protein L24